MHLQICCFASLTSYFFNVLVAVAVVIAKAPYFWQGYLLALSAWSLLQQNHQLWGVNPSLLRFTVLYGWLIWRQYVYVQLLGDVMLGGTVTF